MFGASFELASVMEFAWSNNDADDMALVYEREITSILDRMVPVRTVTCSQRPSDPYYDEECRTMKRCLRRLQRACSQAHQRVAAAVTKRRVRRREVACQND